MKKILGILLLAGLSLFAQSAADNAPELFREPGRITRAADIVPPDNPSLVFQNMGIEETFYLPISRENGFTIKIDFVWPVSFPDSAVLTALQRHFLLKNFGEDYVNLQAEAALKKFYQTETAGYKEENEDLSADETWALSWELQLHDNIVFCNADILQYAISYWQFSGGAHGTGGTSYFLMDLRTGKELAAADVFAPGSEDTVRELIVPGLLAYWEASSLDDMVDEDGKKELLANIWQPGTNFGVTDKGMLFSYSDYELGYYALGQPESYVSWEKILPCLREDSPVYAVARKYLNKK
ncbi:MAG: DUF3298 and DUF4163 domain-containing protein [Fusobacteriaceae bacterium]|jgi:hypothetical protein|nr:DUF3298 and DUF4163 domain-containing protein [Fusobacteriaceae bacterium]